MTNDPAHTTSVYKDKKGWQRMFQKSLLITQNCFGDGKFETVSLKSHLQS